MTHVKLPWDLGPPKLEHRWRILNISGPGLPQSGARGLATRPVFGRPPPIHGARFETGGLQLFIAVGLDLLDFFFLGKQGVSVEPTKGKTFCRRVNSNQELSFLFSPNPAES